MVSNPHYHQAVVNAFNLANAFSNFTHVLKGEGKTVSVAAHSLGNMVTSIAIQDYPSAIKNYFAVDASVPLEAYGDNSTSDNGSMIKVSTWKDYWDYDDSQKKLLASEWHTLFDNDTDNRSQLTWRNRLESVVGSANTNMYNFYSSTEEVLASYDGDNLLFDGDLQEFASKSWVKQEKFKGRINSVDINISGVASKYAGWGFNLNEITYTKINPDYGTEYEYYRIPKSPEELGELDQVFIDGLKTKPFFLAEPEELFDPDTGSDFVMMKVTDTSLIDYYENNNPSNVLVRDWLLAEAFPATTLPMGANENSRLADANFDLSLTEGEEEIFISNFDIWPRKDEDKNNEWYHSDYKDMSFQHVWRFYKSVINLSN